MKKCLFFLAITVLLGCNQTSQKKPKPLKKIIKKESLEKVLIQRINDTLQNKINIERYLDSIIHPEKIKLIEKLEESYSEKEKINIFSSKKYTFKLKTDEFSDESNSIFIDGNHKINFKNLSVLKFDNENFKSEDFGFNFENNLNKPNIIEISGKKFLYADLTFNCNGNGCGCQLNFIYDLKNKKAFVIDNYRFPYTKYFLSDFNNDKIIDIIVISRNKNDIYFDENIEKISYLLTWHEYKNGQFTPRKKKGKESSVVISMYTNAFHHAGDQTDYFLEYVNWN